MMKATEGWILNIVREDGGNCDVSWDHIRMWGIRYGGNGALRT